MSAEVVASELVAALEPVLAEVVAVAPERKPVVDVVAEADLLQKLVALQRGRLVAATMKRRQV